MEKLLQLADQQPTNSELTTTDQTNQELFKQFLTKQEFSLGLSSISKEDYSKKSNGDKEFLILKYYNEMLNGNLLFLWLQKSALK